MAVFKVYHEFLTKVTEKKNKKGPSVETKDDESSEDDDVAWSDPTPTPGAKAAPEAKLAPEAKAKAVTEAKTQPFEEVYEGAMQAALVALRELERESRWCSPPQDEVPEMFLCAMSSGVMKVPSYSKTSPNGRRIER